MLTEIVRSVWDQGKGSHQQSLQLLRLGAGDPRAEELGEVVGIAQRQVEEGDGQETRRAEVDGHNLVVVVFNEVVTVHVRQAEA